MKQRTAAPSASPVGSERLALVREERAALAVGGILEGARVGLRGVAGIAELHEGVAAQVVDLARDLGGVLAGFEQLGGGGEIACAIGVARALEQI